MEFRITALGVGHGDAFLLRWFGADHEERWTCLVDGGAYPEILQKHLCKLNIESLDLVIGTHPDSDHIGGLLGLANQLNINSYWAPPLPAFERHLWLFGKRCQGAIKRCRTVEDSFRQNGTKILYPMEGYSSEPFGFFAPRIHVLSPATRLIRNLLTKDDVSELFTSEVMPLRWCLSDTEDDFDQVQEVVVLDRALATCALEPGGIIDSFKREREERADEKNLREEWSAKAGTDPEFFGDSVLNNTSIVCWLEIPMGDHTYRVLLPGDQENWTYLLARNPRGLHADVLKASHHGGQIFIEQLYSHNEIFSYIRPKVVLVSANGCHGLPRSTIREAAIRWGAAVLCTSERREEIIIGPGSTETCCHQALACDDKSHNIELTLDPHGIRSSRRSCHPGLGMIPGPVIELRQHIISPSSILDHLAEHELRRHLTLVQKKLREIHKKRKNAAEMEPGSELISDAQIIALAPDEYHQILAAHLPTILSKGQERGLFWARKNNSYKSTGWLSYCTPNDTEIKEYLEFLLNKEVVIFPNAVDRVHRDRDSLVTRLDTQGLACFADATLHFPTDTFQQNFWSAVVKAFMNDKIWHCYIDGNDIVFSRHSDQRQLLESVALAFLVDTYDRSDYLFNFSTENFSSPYLYPILFGGNIENDHGKCPSNKWQYDRYVQDRWMPTNGKHSEIVFNKFIDLADESNFILESEIYWQGKTYQYLSSCWSRDKFNWPKELVASIETGSPIKFKIDKTTLKSLLIKNKMIESIWYNRFKFSRLW